MSENDINSPWVEEFRPKRIEDVIGANHLVEKMNEYIDNNSIPHLLFVGGAGTGKTTVAKILANKIANDNYIYINASDERGMETIRNKVQDFCSVASFSDLKIIILDEADGLTPDAQKVLRAVTEQYYKTCRFILTANYENKLLDPIKSRFQTYKFFGANKNDIAVKCAKILKNKNVSFDKKSKEDLICLVKKYYPDIRSTINNLQRCCIKDSPFRFIDSGDDVKILEKFIRYIKEKSVRKIREEILTSSVDYDSLYNAIYENIKEITSGDKAGEIIVILANYQYQNVIHVNKELNFVACLIEIVNALKV